MPHNPDFEDLIRCLNDAKVEYLIVGAYAVIIYTEPRYTKDIDVWVRTTPDNAEKVLNALKNFGAPIKELTVNDLCDSEMVYQIGVEPNRIDIIMSIKGADFETAWNRKQIADFGQQKAFLLDIEDLIRAKQAAGRPIDSTDVEKLLEARKKQGC